MRQKLQGTKMRAKWVKMDLTERGHRSCQFAILWPSVDGSQPTTNFLAKLSPIKPWIRDSQQKVNHKCCTIGQKVATSGEWMNLPMVQLRKPRGYFANTHSGENYPLTASAPSSMHQRWVPTHPYGWWLIVCFVSCSGFDLTIIKMTGETPEVRSDKSKQIEERKEREEGK